MKTLWLGAKGKLAFIAKAIAMLAVVGGIAIVVWGGYNYNWTWTGFGAYTKPTAPVGEFIQAKTLWDWLGLLIIPIVLAVGGLWFSRAERRNEQRISDEDRQEVTLRTYLEQMSALLLDRNLRQSEPDSESRAVARAWTLTVLRKLNGERKGVVLRFLHESGLISKGTCVISLAGAELREAQLFSANLAGADLKDTFLSKAGFFLASLQGADLSGCILEDADFGLANLDGADLSRAYLAGTDLRAENLERVSLMGAYYERNTKWPTGFNPKNAKAIFVKK